MDDQTHRTDDPGGSKKSNLMSPIGPIVNRLSGNPLRRTISNPSLMSEEDRQKTRQFGHVLGCLPNSRQSSPLDEQEINGSDMSQESVANPSIKEVRFSHVDADPMVSMVRNPLDYPSHDIENTPNRDSLLPLSTSTPMMTASARRPLRPDSSLTANKSSLHTSNAHLHSFKNSKLIDTCPTSRGNNLAHTSTFQPQGRDSNPENLPTSNWNRPILGSSSGIKDVTMRTASASQESLKEVSPLPHKRVRAAEDLVYPTALGSFSNSTSQWPIGNSRSATLGSSMTTALQKLDQEYQEQRQALIQQNTTTPVKVANNSRWATDNSLTFAGKTPYHFPEDIRPARVLDRVENPGDLQVDNTPDKHVTFAPLTSPPSRGSTRLTLGPDPIHTEPERLNEHSAQGTQRVSGQASKCHPVSHYDSDAGRSSRLPETRSSRKDHRDKSPHKSKSKKSYKKRKKKRCRDSSSSDNSSESTESTDDSDSSDSSSSERRSGSRSSPPPFKKIWKDYKKSSGRRADKGSNSDQVYINLLKGMKNG